MNMKENIVNLNGIRQTYILMYEQDDIKYIINRSIKWDGIMSSKKIQKLVNLLGENAIFNFLEKVKNMEKNINDMTRTFVVDLTKFSILEIHPEWQNYNRIDQKNIEKRKTDLCEKYDAVKRINDIPNGKKIDFELVKIMKKALKKWLVDIYNEIANYAHLIKDEMVNNVLCLTIENIKKEIDILNNQKKQLEEGVDKLNKMIMKNRKTLAKQNYVIDKFYKQYDFTDNEKKYIETNSWGYLL